MERRRGSWDRTDFLASAAEDPADLLAEEDYRAESGRRLTAALGDLDDRSRDILQQRWLADSKTTLQELADVYGVSAERIRQLEKNALKKLKKSIDG